MEKRAFGLRKWKGASVSVSCDISCYHTGRDQRHVLKRRIWKGIRWIYDETYEDSDAFCSQLGIDISNILPISDIRICLRPMVSWICTNPLCVL